MNSLGIARVIRTKGDPAQQVSSNKPIARAKRPKAVNRMGKRTGRQQVNKPSIPPITINIHNNLPAASVAPTSPMRKRKPVVKRTAPTRVVASKPTVRKPVVKRTAPARVVASKPTVRKPVVKRTAPTRVVASKPVVKKAAPKRVVAKKPTAKKVVRKVARTALKPLSLIAKGGSAIAKGIKRRKAKKVAKKNIANIKKSMAKKVVAKNAAVRKPVVKKAAPKKVVKRKPLLKRIVKKR